MQLHIDEQLRRAVRNSTAHEAEVLIERGARVNHVSEGTHATVLITAAFQVRGLGVCGGVARARGV